MPKQFISRRIVAAITAACALAIPAAALGHLGVDHNSPGSFDRAPYNTSGKGKYRTEPASDATSFSAQHGGTDQHLPATQKNVKLLSEFEPTTPFGPVVAGQIADLSIYKTTAYLNSWSESSCTRGGVYTVDISDPKAPTQRGFIPALPGNYHGEGAHVISVDTKAFKGDLLAVNNEFCTDTPASGGGFDLYDVTNPADPKILVQGFGDNGGEGQLTGPKDGIVNDYHSVFLWQAGSKAYLVGVDNIELHDVDIFDVSDPARPKPVAEHDLLELFPSIEDQSANNDEIFHHDMVVKQIDGRQIMSASYWDAGYVILDVTNPAKPQLIRDSSFDGPDPLTGDVTAEGNGHESEFSHDNKYLLAADEDFAPYRPKQFEITTGPHAGQYPASEVGGGTSQASLPDQTLNGPVVYGGYGCPGASRIPARSETLPAELPVGEEAIVVLQRGPTGDTNDGDLACFPGEKAAEAKNAGYDAVILMNRHLGSADVDEAYCGSGGYPEGVTMVTLCVSHAAGHALFADTAEYTTPYDDEVEMAALGTVGEKVNATSEFDGWGYGQLYRNSGTKMERIDSFAVPEALDPAYAFGYGDLSIHEFATDPDKNIAYSAYYAAGLRVFKFGESGISEVGRYIAEGGNNFWGIEQYTTAGGKRLVAASDRDHGLFLFQYTGR
jgi:hypothetical protein